MTGVAISILLIAGVAWQMRLRLGGVAAGLLAYNAAHLWGWPAGVMVCAAWLVGALSMWWDGPRR
jgi:hypothetical protein